MGAVASTRIRAAARLEGDEPGAVTDFLRVWDRPRKALLVPWTKSDFSQLSDADPVPADAATRAAAERRVAAWVGASPLHIAAGSGSGGTRVLSEMIRLLNETNPADVPWDARDSRGLTSLSRAVRADCAAKIHLLVLAGADASSVYCDSHERRGVRHYWSQLRFSAATGRVAALTALLSQGADNMRWHADGKRSIHLAIEKGQLACVQILLTADLSAISVAQGERRRVSLALDKFLVRNATNKFVEPDDVREGDDGDGDSAMEPTQTAVMVNDPDWEVVTDDAASEALTESVGEGSRDEEGSPPLPLPDSEQILNDGGDGSEVVGAERSRSVLRFGDDFGMGSSANSVDGTSRLARIFRQALRRAESDTPEIQPIDPAVATMALGLNRDRGSSLYHLAASYGQLRVLAYLLSHDTLAEWHLQNSRNEQGKGPIFMAARRGSIPCLALFLEKGASINAVDLENWTVLNEAVKYNQIDTVRYIIEKGGDVRCADDDAWTPLHVAGRFGIVAAIEPLVAAGGDINAVTEDRETPLLLACSQNGHADVVRTLLKHGAKPQIDAVGALSPLALVLERKDYKMLSAFLAHFRDLPVSERPALNFSALSQDGEGLFFRCISSGVPDIMSHLLALGVSADVRNRSGDSPLSAAVRLEKADAVRALLVGGANPDFPQENGSRAMHIASDEGFAEIVRLLAEHGADLEEPVPSPALHEGFTPLMLATRRGHTECVRVLLQAGAPPDTTKKDGYTAVHLAALNGQVGALEVLLEIGANHSLPEENQFAPLHVAVRNNQLEAVRTLLTYGVSPDLRGPSGLTALHFAAYMTNARMIWLLLAVGANPNAVDNDGSCALHVAAGRERGRVAVQMLLTQGAHIGARDEQGDSPLHSAAYRGLYAIVKVLARRGGVIDARNQLGLTPLHLAAAHGSENTVEALLRAGAEACARANNGATPYQLATRANKFHARVAIWRAAGQTLDRVAAISMYSVRSPDASPGASAEIVVNGDRGRTICVVCQLSLRFQEEVRMLPCQHIYHSDCILGWTGGLVLNDHHTCPLCNASMLPDDFEVERLPQR